ncbi:hypothetical protein TYRP_014014 [Tyrophagus putrescentiae]|nr:hypothetical protein TYRP_014014 [Tyrophagus putrescentiae]
MTCFNQKMCNGTFGIGTTCYTPGWSGYCGCDASFKLNPRTQICVQSKSALKGSCTFDSECGLNGLCQGGHCGCAFAHVPSRWNDVNCDQLQCNTDGQCKSHFGDNTLCNQLYNVCQCSPDATLDSVTQTCVKSNIKY